MPDEPRKIFDLMDTETEPTDEQLAEVMRSAGETVRAESVALKKLTRQEAVRLAQTRLNSRAAAHGQSR